MYCYQPTIEKESYDIFAHKTLFLSGFTFIKKCSDGYAQRWGKLIQHQNVRAGESALPFWHCLRRNAKFIGNLALLFARLAPQACKPTAKFFRVQHWHLLFSVGSAWDTNAPDFLEIFPLPSKDFSYRLVGVRYPWGERKISDFVRTEHNPPPFFVFIWKTQLYFPHSPQNDYSKKVRWCQHTIGWILSLYFTKALLRSHI